MGEGNGNDQALEALHALRARGLDQAEQMLELATPAQLMTVCHRFDRRRAQAADRGQTLGPGVMVRWIKDGEFEEERPPESPRERLEAQFEEYAARLPVGTPIHSPHYRSVRIENPPPHAKIWDRIRQENCPGTVRIVGANFPTIVAECDQCRYDCATPVAQLHTLEPVSTQEAF